MGKAPDLRPQLWLMTRLFTEGIYDETRLL